MMMFTFIFHCISLIVPVHCCPELYHSFSPAAFVSVSFFSLVSFWHACFKLLRFLEDDFATCEFVVSNCSRNFLLIAYPRTISLNLLNKAISWPLQALVEKGVGEAEEGSRDTSRGRISTPSA
jgi:hypothetical protein